MYKINKTKYKINEDNFSKTIQEKNQIIIANSLRKNNYQIIRMLHKEYGKYTGWPTFTISRNGEIFQHYNPKYYSDFMGSSLVDKHSISIMLENMCALKLNEGRYVNNINEECEESNIIYKQMLSEKYWEKFYDYQLEALAWLINNLSKDFNIENKMINFQHYNATVSNFKGIVFRSNFIDNDSDINPLFDIMKFKENLKYT